jgi:hypothetical protein
LSDTPDSRWEKPSWKRPRWPWESYGLDGNHDGTTEIYDPEDAIPSAAAYLSALLRRADGNLNQAILGYNHSPTYVRDVLARARAYARTSDEHLATTPGEPTNAVGCADSDLAGPAGPTNLRDAERVAAPRAYRALPSWALAGPSQPGAIDARLYDDAVWILRRYHLRVSAAREEGHNTHGDGTAVDLIPADGHTQAVWDAAAGRLAHNLGWTAACARSGTRPACHLAPAIQFIGYDGYPSHGSPRTCTGGCPAHLHLSWASPCYGTSRLSAPCAWVMAFRRPAGRLPGHRAARILETRDRRPTVALALRASAVPLGEQSGRALASAGACPVCWVCRSGALELPRRVCRPLSGDLSSRLPGAEALERVERPWCAS